MKIILYRAAFVEILTNISNYRLLYTAVYSKIRSKKTNLFLKNKIKLIKQCKYLCISQKLNNPKNTISSENVINTFSVGSVIVYFKIKQGKFVRRSLKGAKIFLNFLKNVFLKKFSKKNESVILNITGIDYNLMYLKKMVFNFFENNNLNNNVFMMNIKIPFTKTKQKKRKSIKKRLKKKIISLFLKKK